MESEQSPVLARCVFRPAYETELQLYRAARSKLRLVLLIVLGAACIAYLLSMLIRQALMVLVFKNPIGFWVLVACLAAFIALYIWAFFSPSRNAKRRLRRGFELYGDLPTVVTEFYDDGIRLKIGERQSDIRLSYPIIVRCMETRDLILLETKEKQIVQVHKAALEGLDVPGFKALIREKCPKAKIQFTA